MSNVYDSLDPSRSEVRFLQVEAFSEDDHPFRGRLHREVLKETKKEYIALSYVWGDSEDTHTIRLNDQDFLVTSNLYWALQALSTLFEGAFQSKPGQEPRLYLWIDAICINQQNVDEKSTQIPLMRDIYQRAEGVIAYLGRGTEETTLAFETMEKAKDEIGQSAYQGRNFNWMQLYPCIWECNDEKYGNAFWKGMKQIWDAEFWTRVWILQEVALAQRVFFLTNHYANPVPMPRLQAWNRVHHIWLGHGVQRPDFIKSSFWSGVSVLGSTGLNTMAHMGTIRSQLANFGNKKWTVADIDRFRRTSMKLRASNPKDKVYGLLALFDLDVFIDYSETTPVSRIYSEFARLCIEAGTGPDLLMTCAGIGWNFGNEFKLPSWAPDWHALSHCHHFGNPVTMAVCYDCYEAHRGIDAPLWTLNPHKTTLITHGCCIGTCEDLGRVLFPAGDSPVLFEYDLLSSFCLELLTQPQPFMIVLLRDLFRTLLRDTNHWGGWDSSTLPRLYSPEHNQELVGKIMVFLRIILETNKFGKEPDAPGLLLQRLKNLGMDFARENWQQFLSRQFFPDDKEIDHFELPAPVRELIEPDSDAQSNIDGQDIRAVVSRNVMGISELVTWANSCSFDSEKRMNQYISLCIQGNRILQLPDGSLAITPPDIRQGDMFCVLSYASCPVVLRPNKEHFEYVGSCYVHGFMDGEAGKGVSVGELYLQEFAIC